MTKQSLGRTDYVGYDSIEEACYDMSPECLSMYAWMVRALLGEENQQGSATMTLDIAGLAEAKGVEPGEIYRDIARLTQTVIRSEFEDGSTNYTSLIVSVTEIFDAQGEIHAISLIIPTPCAGWPTFEVQLEGE